MKRRLTVFLAFALLLGGCGAQPPAGTTPPQETITQEQIDVVDEKYGLEPPSSPAPSSVIKDWGFSFK